MSGGLPEIRVLLVEDNSVDVELVKSLLHTTRPGQITVSHAATLKDALVLLKAGKFSAILLDLSLSDGFGLETFQQVHEMVPRMPIVVLSGFNDESVALKAIQAGAQDYLPKGEITGVVLVRTIFHAIERQKLTSDLRLAAAEIKTLRQQLENARETGQKKSGG